jgi:hypothetical protein
MRQSLKAAFLVRDKERGFSLVSRLRLGTPFRGSASGSLL